MAALVRTCALWLCAFLLAALGPPSRASAQEPPPTPQQAQEVTLDFQDADIRAVLSALAELMGANVVYAGLPAQAVTLKINTPVPRDSLRGIFMSVLKANGLIAFEESGVIRVAARPPGQEPGAVLSALGQTRLFVIRLKHAHALEVAGVINGLFGRPVDDLATRPSLRGTRLSEQLRGQLIPPGLQQAEPAAAAEPALMGAATRQRPGFEAGLEGEVTIVPDVPTNSLLIRATPADFEVIREAVEQLDIRPLQVMIEVLIAEVRKDALMKLGLEVLLSNEPSGGDTRVDGSLGERILGNLIMRIMHLDALRVDALFEALSTSSDVSILSRPVLVTVNNHEASILVGTQQPFIQVSRALPTEAAVRDQVVQFRDVGTKLTVIPTINYDGYVTLSLVQEVSVATEQIQFGAPVISTREVSTLLFVRDGQTVVIGGLIDRQRERTRSGIPLLKDIPIIGALFGSSSWRTVETELFLFLTPHVLATDEDVDAARERIEEAASAISERMTLPISAGDGARADTTGSERQH